MAHTSVLFVCLGNICRSPTAEGVFRQLTVSKATQGIEIDSAGTSDWHIGSPPDNRARQAAIQRGIDLGDMRGRQIQDLDFEKFDYIIAMDHANLRDLISQAPDQYQHKLHLFLSFADRTDIEEVPDPYYGGANGFDQVIDLIEHASEGLLNHIIGSR